VRFQILAEANMKMTAFWNIALCSLVKVDRRFRAAYCLHHQCGAHSLLTDDNDYDNGNDVNSDYFP
jgi:hypothetical protein